MAPRITSKEQDAARHLSRAERCLVDSAEPSDALEAAREALQLFRELKDERGESQAALSYASALVRSDSNSQPPPDADGFITGEADKFEAAGNARGCAAMKIARVELRLEDRSITQIARDQDLEMARDAKATFIDLGDLVMEAKATAVVAMVLIKKCDRAAGPKCAREALKYARECCAMALEMKDRRLEAKANYLLFSAKIYSLSLWKDAVKYAKEAARIFDEVGARWWTAVCCKTAADWAARRGNQSDAKEAKRLALQCLEIFREIEPGPEGSVWEAAGLICYVAALGIDDPDGALKAATDGVERLKASGNKTALAQAHTCLMQAHVACDNFDEAVREAEETLAIYRDLGDKVAERMVLEDISYIQAEAENTTEAFSSYQEAFEKAKELGDVRYQARNMSAIVRVHLSCQEPEKALVAADQALQLYQEIEDREGEGVVLLNMASAHMALDEYPLAISECTQAREVFEEMDMKDRQALAFHFLGEAYSRHERLELGLTAYQQARVLYHGLGDKSQEASMALTIAQLNLSIAEKASANASSNNKDAHRRARKMYTAALKFSREGLAIARKLDDREGREGLLGNLLFVVAQSMGILGKFKDALKFAKEALRFHIENSDRTGECSTNLLLAQIHSWNDKKDEAKEFATKGADLAAKLKDEYWEQMASWIMHTLESKAPGAGPQPTADDEIIPVSAADSMAIAAAGPYSGPSAEDLVPQLSELALMLLPEEELETDSPLMDSGLDSLSMVQFRNTLQQKFPGVPMPASLIFDHPSVRALADYIVEELQEAHNAGRPLM